MNMKASTSAKISNSLRKALSEATNETEKEVIARFTTEFEWFEADRGREGLLDILYSLALLLRRRGIVLSPCCDGIGSVLFMRLIGITIINAIEWDLPFECFTEAIECGETLLLETGSEGIDATRECLSGIDGTLVRENGNGLFEINFLDGTLLKSISIKVEENAEFDRLRYTIKRGWKKLDEDILSEFKNCDISKTIWFDSEEAKQMLRGFQPESMADLTLLNTLTLPGFKELYPDILQRRMDTDRIESTGSSEADRILRETYGVLLYREQATSLKKIGIKPWRKIEELAYKGQMLGHTMMSVELVNNWLVRHSLKKR